MVGEATGLEDASMLATIVHRGLTVWIDPVARSARIQVHMPGRPESHVVLVQPRDGGWTVEDDREDEPIWFGLFEPALGEAIACGAQALEDRLLAELRSGIGRGPGQRVDRLADSRPEPPWPPEPPW
jgi:hypothetical protein